MTFPLRFWKGTPQTSSSEFPAGAAEWSDGVTRRRFVQLLGASALAAQGIACAGPSGKIVPYADQPPEVTPGVPLHFATAMEIDGFARGLIVQSREGRPVKVEGNPEHPATLGAAGVFEQGSVLQLYDPDRGRFVTESGRPASWAQARAAFDDERLRRIVGARGDGLHFLLEPTASPLVRALVDRVRERYPAAHTHYYAPLVTDHVLEGTRRAFGQPLQPILDLTRADVILSADDDLLASGPFAPRYARQFADRRRVRSSSDRMNRLYAIDGLVTVTGVSADHRLRARPGEVPALLAALAAHLGVGSRPTASDDLHEQWVRVVAADLAAHRGRAVVTVGDRQPPAAHALACAINAALGATGATVGYVDAVRPPVQWQETLPTLVEAMHTGTAAAVVVIGGDPSYTGPAGSGFAEAIRTVPLSMYVGLYPSATSRDTRWYVPLAHYLESWGDAAALDGTASIVQPLIAPLFGGVSPLEVLALFAGDRRSPYDLVRNAWMGHSGDDEAAWESLLRRGIVPGTARDAVAPGTADAAAALDEIARATRPPLEVVFTADPSIHDGRFGNNAWLQELPDPITKLTWDNAACMSEATARRLGLEQDDDGAAVVRLAAGGGEIRAPALVVPGFADDTIALAFGYGQSGAGRVASDVGANAYLIWPGQDAFIAPVSAAIATRFRVALRQPLAITQPHWSLEGRPVLLDAALEEFRAHPDFTRASKGPAPTLYHYQQHEPRQWAMAIDLTVCTGCSACVVACQAENNIPSVGKPGVMERREMHWLRIDRYTTGHGIAMQPMLCQHCEMAPCEYVCPVNATVHSPDGLNEMIYNRCVGTRFCSNNCPYKVRRFNWLNYTADMGETQEMAMNPDVTVRARGVMEKCTFCVQRIRRTGIDAALSGSDRPYEHLQTACEQACPTRAIVFGSIADPDSEVARTAGAPQSYQALHDLGTRPRVHYLARLRNLNPAIPGEPA